MHKYAGAVVRLLHIYAFKQSFTMKSIIRIISARLVNNLKKRFKYRGRGEAAVSYTHLDVYKRQYYTL